MDSPVSITPSVVPPDTDVCWGPWIEYGPAYYDGGSGPVGPNVLPPFPTTIPAGASYCQTKYTLQTPTNDSSHYVVANVGTSGGTGLAFMNMIGVGPTWGPLALPGGATTYWGGIRGGGSTYTVAWRFYFPGCTPPVPCEYGVELTDTGHFLYQITQATIAQVLLKGAWTWLAPLFDPIIGRTIDMLEPCSAPPPTPDEVLNDSFQWTGYDLERLFVAIAWHTLCHCKAGATTPIDYPLPVITRPTGWPDKATFDCSNTNVCAILTQLANAVYALNAKLGQTMDLVALQQRYHVPFAYINGAAHSGLVGSGSFAVSRLLGVRIEITGGMPGRTLEGNPPYVWDLGWASVLDGNGFIQERRITRQSEVWQPETMQEALTFGYYLHPGVTARVTELEPEP